MILPNIDKERKAMEDGFNIVIGVDEVGRGPLAGPVVAGAAWVNPEILEKDFEFRDLIRDSKKLSEKQRDRIYKFIQESEDFILGIGEVSVEMIDKINILNAALLAMRLAVDEVKEQINKIKDTTEDKFCALIDGNKNIQNLEMEQRLFAKGDQRIFSIAAASVNAKVYRDELMKKYHQKFPEYGFDRHKGYGTKFHIEQLNKIGACEIHRRSFAPVRRVLG
jgi:ribonuclease HII